MQAQIAQVIRKERRYPARLVLRGGEVMQLRGLVQYMQHNRNGRTVGIELTREQDDLLARLTLALIPVTEGEVEVPVEDGSDLVYDYDPEDDPSAW